MLSLNYPILTLISGYERCFGQSQVKLVAALLTSSMSLCYARLIASCFYLYIKSVKVSNTKLQKVERNQ